MTVTLQLGPNDLVPCPSRSARKRHLAKAELCPICDPQIERPGACPVCHDPVSVLGDRYQPHDREGVEGERCPGSGLPARPLSPLAANLRAERRRRGWTQQELADRAGLKQGVVASFEAGVSPLRAANLTALCRALGFEQLLAPRGAA